MLNTPPSVAPAICMPSGASPTWGWRSRRRREVAGVSKVALRLTAGFGSQLTLLGGSKAGVPAQWRPGRGRGAVHGSVREHTDRLRAPSPVSSALRTPSPARPHNPGLAGHRFVAGQENISSARRGPRWGGRHCASRGFAARGPRALTQGRAGLGRRSAAAVLLGPLTCDVCSHAKP